MPLRAIENNMDFWAEELAEEDRLKKFSCPLCKECFIPIIPKMNIIKHFRHKTGKEHWEPETQEHLNGKRLIASWFNETRFPQIEKIIKNKYIADVFFEYTYSIPVVIEFQCSLVSYNQFLEKQKFYLHYGYTPIWIFGGKWTKNTQKYYLWERTTWDNSYNYEIQRSKKIERYLWDNNKTVLYLIKNNLYIGVFKNRWNSETLGWYNLKYVPTQYEEEIMFDIALGEYTLNKQRNIAQMRKFLE